MSITPSSPSNGDNPLVAEESDESDESIQLKHALLVDRQVALASVFRVPG